MKREVKIGIFTVVILCGSWAGLRFLNGIDIFKRSVDYYVNYTDINGISTASPILIQGVKVGAVTDVYLNPLESTLVTVKLSVKRRYALPEGTVARIYTPGLMSSTSIGLTLGDSPVMHNPGDTLIAQAEAGLMDQATEKLFAVADQVSAVGGELTEALNSVNKILENSGSNIDSTLANLDQISTELASLLSEQSGNLAEAIEGFTKFSATLGDNTESIESVVANLEALSTELSEANLGGSLSTTLEELNTTLAKVNSAEGSAGKLIADEELYDNLSAVSGSLNELIVDMQANPKRYVHFSLFGSNKDK